MTNSFSIDCARSQLALSLLLSLYLMCAPLPAGAESTRVIVPSRDIEKATALNSVEWVEADCPKELLLGTEAITAREELNGLFARTKLPAHQRVPKSAVSTNPTGFYIPDFPHYRPSFEAVGPVLPEDYSTWPHYAQIHWVPAKAKFGAQKELVIIDRATISLQKIGASTNGSQTYLVGVLVSAEDANRISLAASTGTLRLTWREPPHCTVVEEKTTALSGTP